MWSMLHAVSGPVLEADSASACTKQAAGDAVQCGKVACVYEGVGGVLCMLCWQELMSFGCCAGAVVPCRLRELQEHVCD